MSITGDNMGTNGATSHRVECTITGCCASTGGGIRAHDIDPYFTIVVTRSDLVMRYSAAIKFTITEDDAPTGVNRTTGKGAMTGCGSATVVGVAAAKSTFVGATVGGNLRKATKLSLQVHVIYSHYYCYTQCSADAVLPF